LRTANRATCPRSPARAVRAPWAPCIRRKPHVQARQAHPACRIRTWARFPAGPASAGLQWQADGFGALSEQAFVQDFAGDLPRSEALGLYAVQQRVGKPVMQARTTAAPWRQKPSWYAVSSQDGTIDPELQRFMVRRMKATTIELPASHVSLLSRPAEVAELIIAATQAGAKERNSSRGFGV
jgi:pimeloyl-ACP methyl ester carboxylesterase